MARNRNFVRGAVAIRKSRENIWFEFAPVDTTVASGSAIIFSLNAVALALRPFTIVRTRVALALKSDQSAAIEVQAAGFGIAVVSDQAVAVGISAVPTPISELGSSLWLMHSLIYGDESDLTDRTRPQTNQTLDSKAMRKVEVGQDLIWVVEKATPSQGLILTAGGRMLILNN